MGGLGLGRAPTAMVGGAHTSVSAGPEEEGPGLNPQLTNPAHFAWWARNTAEFAKSKNSSVRGEILHHSSKRWGLGSLSSSTSVQIGAAGKHALNA